VIEKEIRIRLLGEAINDYSELKERKDKQARILLNSIDTF